MTAVMAFESGGGKSETSSRSSRLSREQQSLGGGAGVPFSKGGPAGGGNCSCRKAPHSSEPNDTLQTEGGSVIVGLLHSQEVPPEPPSFQQPNI